MTPMLNVVRPTNLYFGHLFEIILFKDLLLFCVLPCKHVDNSSLILRFLNTGFNNFLNVVCIPGLCLYVALPLTISLWYLHHDNSVFGKKIDLFPAMMQILAAMVNFTTGNYRQCIDIECCMYPWLMFVCGGALTISLWYLHHDNSVFGQN